MAAAGASKIVPVQEWIAFLEEYNYSKDIRVYNDKDWSEAYRKIQLNNTSSGDFIIIPNTASITDFYCIFKRKTKNGYPVVVSLSYDPKTSMLQYWNMIPSRKLNRDDLYPQPPERYFTSTTVTLGELLDMFAAIPRMAGGSRHRKTRRNRSPT